MSGKTSILAVLTLASVLGASLVSSSALAQSNVAQTIRYGEIVSMRQVVVKDPPTATGTQVGATAGAVAGYALADGGDKWLGGLLGGVVGGAVGRSASAKKRKGWELIIKIDDGGEIGVQIPGKKKQYNEGDRVRLMTGPGGKTEVIPLDE